MPIPEKLYNKRKEKNGKSMITFQCKESISFQVLLFSLQSQKKIKDGVTQIVIFWLMLYRKSDRIMKNNQVLIPGKIDCDHTRWSSFEENN